MNCQLERPGRNREQGQSRYRDKGNQESSVSSREAKEGRSGGEPKGSETNNLQTLTRGSQPTKKTT